MKEEKAGRIIEGPSSSAEPELGLNVSVLVDDCAGYNSVRILAEHGLSLVVEYGGRRILLDTGQSSVFARNSRRMGVDLGSVSMVAISHGHYDHTGGLPHLLRAHASGKQLVAHPDAFETKVTKDGREVGCPVSLKEVEQGFQVLLLEKTHKIARNAYFLTGLERKHEDPGTVVFHISKGRREPDPVLDDSSLVLKTERGLFIVCGCAHSGLLNIVNEAVDLLGDEIYGLAGGFHLLHASGKRIGSLIARLKELKVEKVYPCHCTGIRATYLMQSGLRAEKVGSGDVIRI